MATDLSDYGIRLERGHAALEAEYIAAFKRYHVTANTCDFGVIEARSPEEARDLAAQMAGYASEDDMEARLEQPSEIVAEDAE